MSLLTRFEEVAELLFTGPFRKKTARLQPVEIAKELVKEMLRHKQISISQVYVPNVYRIYLNPEDWSPLANFGETFLIELSKHLYREGERHGYTFISKPLVELHADDSVRLREMVVEAVFDDSAQVSWEDEEEMAAGKVLDKDLWHGHTTIFQNEGRSVPAPENTSSRNLDYILEIIQGPDMGKKMVLASENIYIGRHTRCEFVLSDPEVSRRHVKLTRCEQGWLLDDLGSTNGTQVNERRISRQLVVPGDRIRLGQSVIIIKQL
jgi:hypothetical protein